MISLFKVKPVINKLGEDSDFDVRFFASEAATGNFHILKKMDKLIRSKEIFIFTACAC